MINAEILIRCFRNNYYAQDLNEYIKDSYKSGFLSYNNLKYLYKNLYQFHSYFVKQNIYPVCEFLKKGYSTEQCEKVADLLEDAKDKSIFCSGKRDMGYKYNKLFYDLMFCYESFDKYIKQGYSEDYALFNIKCDLEITTEQQRYMEYQLDSNYNLTKEELNSFDKDIKKQMSQLKNDIVVNNKDTFINTKKYNRLSKTKTKLNKYLKEKNIKMKSYER